MKWIRGIVLSGAWVASVLGVNAETVALTSPDAFGVSSFNTGLNWANGLPPEGTNDYVVATLVATNPMTLRTPAVAGGQVFAGNSLTLGNGTTNGNLLYKGNGGADVITISNLTLNLGTLANGMTPTNPFIVAGDITLGAGGGFFDQGAAGRFIMVSSVVVGVGGATIFCPAGGAGTVTFAANNSYQGPTTIATGMLVVGTGLAAGSMGGGAVTNRGTLVMNRSDSYLLTNSYAGDLGALYVRAGDMTLLNQGLTNFVMYVGEPAGAVTNVTLNLSNSFVVTKSGALNSFLVGGVANAGATGIVNMSGGQLHCGGELWVATGTSNSRGIFNLYDGLVRVSNWCAVGRGAGANNAASYGELNISGGSWSNVANNNVSISSFLGNTGVVNVTGGRLYAQNSIFVGESGMGYLNVGNTGVVDANVITAGDRNNGAGAVVITGGVLQARSTLAVANAVGTTGSLALGPGQIFANVITQTGTGTITLTAGTIAPYNTIANFSAPMGLSTVPTYGGNGVVTFQSLGANAVAADILVHGVLSGDGSVVKTGPGALMLNGNNSYSGPTTVSAGYLFGTGSVVSAVTVSNGAFLGPNSLLQFGTFVVNGSATLESGAGIAAFLNGGTASLIVAGTLTANGPNPVNLLPTFAPVTTGTNTLALYATLSAFNFTTGLVPAGVQGYLQDNPSAQAIEFVVTNVVAGAGLVWSGAVNNQWDVQTTTNWVDGGSLLPTLFNHGDSVRFDDTGTNTAVSIPTAVTPGSIMVSNNTVSYSFAGGGIIGPSTITKAGSGTMLINMASGHTGTNLVLGGTLIVSNATALGSTTGPTVINGGTLDVGGQNLGGEPVVVSGAGVGGLGAIINSGPGNTLGLQYVTLAGDATIGGTNRWDIRNNNAYVDLAGFTLTKTGANYIAMANTMKATNAGSFVINSGTLAFEFAGSEFSGPGNIVVNPGGTMGLYQAANIWKTNVYNGGTILSITGGGTNQIGAPVIINTNSTINSTAGDMSFTNVISGPAGFTKTAANAVILLATNTYEGPTTISAGSVMLGNGVNGNGTLGGGIVSNNSQLIFNRPDSHTVTNLIAGTGQVIARRGVTTLQDTAVTNNALFVLDAAAVANATLNIANSRVYLNNTAANNCNVGMVNGGAVTGMINVSSGLLRSGSEIWVAAGNTNSRGVFNLSGGDVAVSSWSAIGRGNGTGPIGNYGEVNISGGTWSNLPNNNFTIGSFLGNTGRVTVTGGRLYAQNSLWVSESGGGFMTLGGTGVVDVARFTVGQAANGIGTFTINGGTLIARAGDNIIGVNASSYGWLPMSGGTMTLGQNFQVGGAGIGIMEMSGAASVSANAGYPVIGRSVGGRGILDISGGSFTHNNNGTHLIIGEQGGGVLNIRNGGTVTVHSARTGDGARLGHNIGTGLVNVATGGTLVAPAVTRAAGANNTGILSLDGGTLRANTNNAAYAANLNAIHIRTGGANIDDGGFAITITQALRTASGSGLVSVPIVTGGSGYKGPPIVQITGGGSNAAALAQIDVASGTLTNILVTSPGHDFTNLPAVTIAGGAPISAATLGTPVLAANTSGGLNKLGAGTLTLTASNTFNGPTIVSNGVLSLTGNASVNSSLIIVNSNSVLDVAALSAGALIVRNGQTLAGGGTIQGNVNNAGTVSPGRSIDTLQISSGYTQTNGTLNIEIGGAAGPGLDYDQLEISGAATLGGTLNVSFVNGYTGTVDDLFIIATASSITGGFYVTNLPVLAAGTGWLYENLGTAIALSITSAPTATGYDLWAGGITNGITNATDSATADGYPNLLKYATGSNPNNPDNLAQMNQSLSNGLFALRFNHNTNATDITLIIEGTYTSTNDAIWNGIATNIHGSWGATTNYSENTSTSPASVTVWDTETAATNRFLRLRVTRP